MRGACCERLYVGALDGVLIPGLTCLRWRVDESSINLSKAQVTDGEERGSRKDERRENPRYNTLGSETIPVGELKLETAHE